MVKGYIETLLRKTRQKRNLRRMIALLGVVVFLTTFNAFKFNAITMERTPMCGYEDHEHGPECYDEEGSLTCALHVHTDACFQEAPAGDLPLDAVMGVDAPRGDDSDVPDALPADVEQPGDGSFIYGTRDAVRLSEVLAGARVGLDVRDIEDIGQVLESEDDVPLLRIERLDGDFNITALDGFQVLELALITAGDVFFVRLLDATVEPAAQPTPEPTEEPTAEPTIEPTEEPTIEPTEEPTAEPTAEPTEEPIVEPTEEPTIEPTEEPIVEPTVEPTEEPAEEPTVEPTAEPTEEPTIEPTEEPTVEPTEEPTIEPTEEPTVEPTVEPTTEPTEEPTIEPTEEPTVEPTAEPTEELTIEPTVEPTEQPTVEPTVEPTAEPTEEPTVEPTEEPASEPTVEPTEGLAAESSEFENTGDESSETIDFTESEDTEMPDDEDSDTIDPTDPEDIETPVDGDSEVTDLTDLEETETPDDEETETSDLDPEAAEEDPVDADDALSIDSLEADEADAAMTDAPAADYAARVDVSAMEPPFALSALMAAAEPVETAAPAEAVEAETEDAESAEETEMVEAPSEPAEAASEPLAPADWVIEYDRDAVAVEYVDGEWFVAPLRGFARTEITVDNGAVYALTLENWAVEADPGVPYIDLGLAKISARDGENLPSDATGHAGVLSGEDVLAAIRSVEDYEAAQAAQRQMAAPKKLMKAAPLAAAPAFVTGETRYQVFEIGLDDAQASASGYHVEVTLPQPIVGHDFKLYHIHDGVEPVTAFDPELAINLDYEELLLSFAFDTENFSEFVLSYTVDFHYDVDGESYDYSIVGGSATRLTDLVWRLGIRPQEDAAAFVADVLSVEFSDPTLVCAAKIESDTTLGDLKADLGLECAYSGELDQDDIDALNAMALNAGDWALISLLPFTGEESLTITMKNGEAFTVVVTDVQGSVVTPSLNWLENGEYMIVYANGSRA